MAANGPFIELVNAQGSRRVPVPAGALTIGRNITNLLVIDEPAASRFHCVIEKTKAGYRLRDLDSRNGTFVNGEQVKSHELSPGDVVTIGETELHFSPAGPVARKTAAAVAESEEPVDPEFAAFSELAAALEPPAPDAMPEPEEEAQAPAYRSEIGGPDWERTLRDRAESLPLKPFRETDIALINARGQTAHATQAFAGKTQPGAESLVMLRLILLICFRSRATDIHIEMQQEDVLVRIRVDGTMVEILHLYRDQRELAVRVLSMVKVISEIDIAHKNIVQEGSFSARVPMGKPGSPVRRVDYRVSFAPAVYGQKLVIRILDVANAPQHIDDLQLPKLVSDSVRTMIRRESGMILVCGPTGSGKTTTLYSILRDINLSEHNVVTIEDPVEIQLEGVTQIPVNDAQGNTFSALLKSVLRQDPDILLVGEVRDPETARIAVQSAMTGHLVFTTVHSRDAVGAVYRLLDLGVEPYLVSSGLQMVLAQRLVRQLCPHCKQPQRPSSAEAARMAEYGLLNVQQIYDAKGCRRCLNTGFFGRRTVVELLSFNQALRDVVLKTPTMQEILKMLGPDNYSRLAENGFRLVADGVTSFDEADRAVS
ncbi:MAG TPA: ATPase, T2SS/T4P/T4SS family [Tepidisphaeraceae bacterium]|nr:ATPase, T2SS/T4P/T4SS family [Tepidisphaeraceae bacterium]